MRYALLIILATFLVFPSISEAQTEDNSQLQSSLIAFVSNSESDPSHSEILSAIDELIPENNEMLDKHVVVKHVEFSEQQKILRGYLEQFIATSTSSTPLDQEPDEQSTELAQLNSLETQLDMDSDELSKDGGLINYVLQDALDNIEFNDDDNAVNEEKIYSLPQDTEVAEEILAANPLLTMNDLINYIPQCLGLIKNLGSCEEFSCEYYIDDSNPTTFHNINISRQDDGSCLVEGRYMPFENELSCRLRDRSSVDNFAKAMEKVYYNVGKLEGNISSALIARNFDRVIEEQCKVLDKDGNFITIGELRKITPNAFSIIHQDAEPKPVIVDVTEAAVPIIDENFDDSEFTMNRDSDYDDIFDITEIIEDIVIEPPLDSSEIGILSQTDAVNNEETSSLENINAEDIIMGESIKADAVTNSDTATAESKLMTFDSSTLNATTNSTPPTKVTTQKKSILSDADKAYLEMLEHKRKKLDKNLQLSKSTSNAFEAISKNLEVKRYETLTKPAPENISLDKDPTAGDTTSDKKFSFDIAVNSHNKAVKVNIQHTLDQGHRALLSGQVAAATTIYRSVLDIEPQNLTALFGLATSYHRNAQYEQAKNIYTEILELDPNYQEALNNFLVLAAKEAPKDALIVLKRLQRINPDFSPVPAQMAMIHLKMNNLKQAENQLKRAMILSPENTTYKYNLAVVYDKQGDKEQAIRLYSELLKDVQKGYLLPTSSDAVAKRLSFLRKR